jgi:hypothetical protein
MMMTKLHLLLLVNCFAGLLLFTSCGSKSAIENKLSGADSLVITFNIPDTDSVINIVSTTEAKAINKLSGFLNGKETTQSKCGFDGNIKFFKTGQQLLPVVFKYSETGCRFFMYDLDNKVMNVAMGNEAAGFLKNLAEGKASY